ncbi:MAG: 2-hydroxychromene-2-carboxylate isomerase [Polyangiaceae bacterium]|nr:2-hydroxychromene-2-carboxylate isomerase [Polyangiaceae bacterium]
MSPEPVTFYFDFISPYAYLAWTQIHETCRRHGRGVEAIPILFAALLDANKTKGPAEIPSKRIYVFKDTLRHAHALGVDFKPPPTHPFNPLLGLRIASIEMGADEQKRAIDALYRATWAGGPGITDPEAVATVLNDAGLDGASLVAQAGSQAIKDRVKLQTQAALERGVFGVPTMIVDGELFWGLDAFGHVERRLRGEDPVTAELWATFRDVQASSTRPGSR